MSARITRARVCAIVCFAFFNTVTFAQVSGVAARANLAGTDFIDWAAWDDGAADGLPDYTWLTSPADIITNGGVDVTVAQTSSPWTLILQEPSPYFISTNIPDGDFIYSTNIYTNDVNPIAFYNFDGMDVCGLGTQIAPSETGAFLARIEGFDADGSMGFFDVAGSDADAEAAFVGISSETPMTEVQISLIDTFDGGGAAAGFFVINRVDLTACVDEPEAPVMSCEGFGAPMHKFPVKVKGKGKRVFPLRMNLFDENGFEQTDIELLAAPVVTVMYTADGAEEAEDVTSDVQSVKKASSGNQFAYTDDGLWQFNLSSRNYTAKGTYLVTADSGDAEEYTIDPSCVTSFVR